MLVRVKPQGLQSYHHRASDTYCLWNFTKERPSLKLKKNSPPLWFPSHSPIEANHVSKKTPGIWNNSLNDSTVNSPPSKAAHKRTRLGWQTLYLPTRTKAYLAKSHVAIVPPLFYGLGSLHASLDELEAVMGSVWIFNQPKPLIRGHLPPYCSKCSQNFHNSKMSL